MNVMLGAMVPSNHPRLFGLKCMFEALGKGTGANPCLKMVRTHHTINIKTITVVICMIRSAF